MAGRVVAPRHDAAAGRQARRAGLVLLAACLLLLPAADARAQVPDAPPEADGRLGPLFYNPGLVFSGGYDTNPWRQTIEEPTATYETYITPQIRGWMTLGHLRVDLFGALEIVKADGPVTDRNYQYGTNLVWDGPKLAPYVLYTSKHTNANPTGFEVGRKSLRIENDVKIGTSFKTSERLALLGHVRGTKTNWDADAMYQTSSLREKLNRTDYGFGGGVELALTPLTTVRFSGESSTSEFVYSPIRNGSGFRVGPGLSIVGPAAINGNVEIGIRQFRSTSSDVSFRGLISNTSLSKQFSSGTAVMFIFDRDLQFSYDTSLAYFVGQSIEVKLIQPIGERLGLQAFAGRHRLLYDKAAPNSVPLNAVNEAGVAIGRQVRERYRVGLIVEWAAAHGNQPWNQLRTVAFLTYGLGPFQRLDRPIPFQR